MIMAWVGLQSRTPPLTYNSGLGGQACSLGPPPFNVSICSLFSSRFLCFFLCVCVLQTLFLGFVCYAATRPVPLWVWSTHFKCGQG